ncbi:MAG: DUF4157 domain-containing protein [Bryobacteraceae bacterium]
MTDRTLSPVLPEAAAAPKTPADVSPRRQRTPSTPDLRPEALDLGLNADFTRLSSTRTIVLDEDQAREWVTRWLLNDLAPALGLDPSKIEIRVNGEAAARTNAKGASGLAENGVVYLNPQRYKPDEDGGRQLLAHELTHVAQARQTARSPLETPQARHNAEREAVQAASDYLSGKSIASVREPLPIHAVAADTGGPATLEQAVAIGRRREMNAIWGYLSGLWISDGDVFDVLRILETMEYTVARAVVKALGPKSVYALCDNINVPHIKRMRKQVFACYAALEEGQFDAVDTDVLAEGPMSGLDRQEKESALRTIRFLNENQKRDLLRSGNRLEIKQLILSPSPLPADPKADADAAKEIFDKEVALADSRQKIGAVLNDKTTESLLSQVRDIIHDREGDSARNMLRVLDLLAANLGDKNRLLALGERMDSEGLIDRLFTLLPEWYFFDTPEHSETLVTLAESRLPIKNLDFVEGLLSYGLLDWAVRDYEAKFAYRIIKLLPLSEQYRFRQRDNGKWFMRLVENLPEEFTSSKDYRGDIEVRKASKEEIAKLREEKKIRTEDEYYDAAQVYQKKKSEAGVGDAIESLKKAFAEAGDAKKPVELYKSLHARVAALGNATLVKGKFNAADQVLMETVVHELDRFGYIERLFKELPDSFLFSEESRIATVKIMMSRDPARVQDHARTLASRRFLDWMVTDREAYLAYLCVKALPDEERGAFLQGNADVWKDIQGEMSKDMRASSDLNFYVGDKEGTDRGSVLGRLAERATWTKEDAPQLDGLLHMAIAMTEHKFAFERSQQFAAYNDKDLKPLVDKYRLYDPGAKRTKYTPEILKGTKWYEEGIFASLRTLWKGLVFLFDNDFLLVTRSVGSVGLNLNELQDVMGGDVAGARLADPEKKFGKLEPNPEANRLTVLFDVGAHALHLSLPELRIDSVSFQAAQATVQTGSILLKDLKVDVAYDTEEATQPTKATLSAGSLELRDMLVSLRASMVAVNRFFLSTFRLGAGTVDTTSPNKSKPRGGYYFPVPFLATIGTLIYYLFKFKGWFTEKPGTEMGHGEEQIRAIDLAFSSLEVDGLTTSGGQSIRNIKVTDFALRAGLNKTTLLRAKIQSLNQRIASAKAKKDTASAEKLEADKKQAETDLAGLVEAEKKLLVIQDRILHGDISKAEEQKLQEQIRTLDLESKGGVFVDIGSIEASGISGTVSTKKSIKLTDLHGEGSSPAAAASAGLSIVTDAELISQVTKGTRPKSAIEQGGDFRLDLGDVHAEDLSVGHGIRTAKDIEAKLKELEPLKAKYEYAPLYEHLQNLLPEAVRYEQYLALGVSTLDKTQLDDLVHLREILAKDPDIIFGAIDLQKAYLTMDASGGVGLGAKEGTVTGVRLPERGISVDKVKIVNLEAKAGIKGGLAGWLDPAKNIQSGKLKAQSITITGARSDFHGGLVDEITVTGREEGEDAFLQVDERGNKISVGLSVQAKGLGLAPRIGLMKQRLDGLKRKDAASPDAKTKKEIAKLREDITQLQALADTRAKAWALYAAAKTPAEKDVAKQALLEAEGIIAYGLKQYGAATASLEGFGFEVSGAGDVLTDVLNKDVNPMKILERGGVRAKGTGPGNRVFKRIAVSGAQTASDEPDASLSAGVGSFEIGETKLDVTAKKSGDSITADVAEFSMASISLDRFELTNSEGDKGYQLWSTGASGISGITFTGSVRLDSKVKGSQDLADYRLAHVHVESFRIDKIYGNGLGFASLSQRLQVEIKSGSINGIHAEKLDVDIPADPKAAPIVEGKAGIDSIDDVVIGKAVVGAWAVDRGRMNAKKLDVEFFKDGAIEASLGSLSLTSFAVRGPDGWVRFSLADVGGKLRYQNGAIDVKEAHLGTFQVSAIHWKVGKKGFVDADRPATIKDVRLKGRIETREVSKPTAEAPDNKERKLSKLKITELHVGSVEAEHLIYQDEDNRIELQSFPKPIAKKQKVPPKPLFLQNLDVWDLEWDEKQGLTKANAKLEHYELSASYDDLKTGMKAGIALTGGGMKAEVAGPGLTNVDIGKIDSIGGTYHDEKIDTKFATGNVVGKLGFGPDFVEASGIEVGGLGIGKTTYKDPAGKSLELHHVIVEKVKLGKVRQNYTASTDPAKPDAKEPTTLEVENLEFIDVMAGKFVYDGTASGTTADGKTETSTQHIEGQSAHLDHFLLSSMVYDKATAETILSFKADNLNPKDPFSPLRIRGLSANLVSQIGTDKPTTTKLVTDVTGGPITADNIKFTTVKLGTVTGPGGKKEDVTRTKIDGGFKITRLGFINPNLTLTDKNGKTTSIAAYEHGSVELKNIQPQFLPNGTARIPIDAIIAKNLQVTRGNVKVKLPFAEIKDIVLGMKGMGTDKGIDFLAAKLGSIHITGLTLTYEKTHVARMNDKDYAETVKEWEEEQKEPSSGTFIAEPLSGLHGKAEGEYELKGIPWPDPDVEPEVSGGVVSMGGMTNYSVMIEKDKLTLGNFWPKKTLVDFGQELPGVYPGAGPSGYGQINIRELVEGLINAPAGKPEQTFKPKAGLNDLRLKGSFYLGDGRIGMDKDADKKLGAGDFWLEFKRDPLKPEQNRIDLMESHIGDMIQLNMPDFHLSGSGFTAGTTQDGKVRQGKTGEITLQGINVYAHGLGDFKLAVTLYIADGKIKDIEIGDLTFLDAAELKKLAEPTLTQVNPKGVPVAPAEAKK